MTALASPLESLRGAVLEIGPGRHPHLPLDPNDPWIGVEPDQAAARWLESQVGGHRVTVLAVGAEELPVPTGSIDTVVTSHALCSVRDPAQVLREVLRVLRPGGRFTFEEHVGSPRGTVLRIAQDALSPITRLIDGCRVNRDTGDLISAAGFQRVELQSFTRPGPLGSAIPHVAGSAYC
ncbi:class I SAM-dependent methyltransferase [Ornithinimicrobium faecis]|uniref:Class I SAM-dependent methyltransferase n=1 Tax=Ornithinimicrobium faecis TaxID=2934158 RepID=A0ABY4YWA4_9MICO|nr:class I SAM-dependent methyltransferase [Ornithinimicrobium sp. HY1793]USQ80745.1 class I SAM-dependent methyltransferase [Ornithinimicrobium sp. HY1793]